MTGYLDLIMFAALMVAILSGFPVSFGIAGVAIAFAYLGWMLGVMDVSLLGALGQRAFGLLTNTVLIAIPVFVLMGAILEKSRRAAGRHGPQLWAIARGVGDFCRSGRGAVGGVYGDRRRDGGRDGHDCPAHDAARGL